MKYIRLFEKNEKKRSELLKLFKYLNGNGLDVEFINSDVKYYGEYINGDTEERPYIIMLRDDTDIIVDYMDTIKCTTSNGLKKGSWSEKRFGVNDYKEIVDFILNLDVMISAKKYNL